MDLSHIILTYKMYFMWIYTSMNYYFNKNIVENVVFLHTFFFRILDTSVAGYYIWWNFCLSDLGPIFQYKSHIHIPCSPNVVFNYRIDQGIYLAFWSSLDSFLFCFVVAKLGMVRAPKIKRLRHIFSTFSP